ncbi:MAG: hydrogenase iron-sulfur subunit [candidate division KSB1 bacterium]|nr:hydrogenase iron-sulfur subunit [candidate division KSB1 bacterium]MDZ7368362.1 hydrogenase iron-sulfur subunit [candidate division KSB1 bacterium]MDZ7403082.1 hydrogenase iron-sulfur subunit [candidate division KSB1 bacterium]
MSENFENPQPRLIGFLCENGAHVFYDVSNPVRRKLPANFIGLPVASINQVQASEVLKAFLSGADGVVIAGCEKCRNQKDQQLHEAHFAALVQSLTSCDIAPARLRWEWISAQEESKFIQLVTDMMESLRQLPPLRLPPRLAKTISYCG